MEGIKETTELAVGSIKLGAVLYTSFADGVQASDVGEVLEKIKADPKLSAALLAAYNDANKVPAELADLTTPEIVELVIVTGKTVLEVISEIKK